MSGSLIAALFGIAVVDSLNPSLFVFQFYLLTKPKPTGRVLAYIAGAVGIYFVGGVLLLAGVRTLIPQLVASIPPSVIHVAGVIVGILLILFGLLYKPKSSTAQPNIEFKRPGLWPAFILGIVVMGQELTTALPYFVAVERITDAQVGILQAILLLMFYNIIFTLPMIGILLAFLRLRDRFSSLVERINSWMSRWMPRISKAFALIFGVLIVIASITAMS